MPDPKPVLQVVVASTRPGRKGPAFADWFSTLARHHGGFEVVDIDLAEVDLPFMDEPNHPRLGQYLHQDTLDWSASSGEILRVRLGRKSRISAARAGQVHHGGGSYGIGRQSSATSA